MNHSATDLQRTRPEAGSSVLPPADLSNPPPRRSRLIKLLKAAVVGFAASAVVLCALGLFVGIFLLIAGLVIFSLALLSLFSLFALTKWRRSSRQPRGFGMRVRFGTRARLPSSDRKN